MHDLAFLKNNLIAIKSYSNVDIETDMSLQNLKIWVLNVSVYS